MSTTSSPSVRARLTASKARLAASEPWGLIRMGTSARSAQTCSCSMAAARKVSPAAISTRAPLPFSSEAILPSVVVLPEPFTPTSMTT